MELSLRELQAMIMHMIGCSMTKSSILFATSQALWFASRTAGPSFSCTFWGAKLSFSSTHLAMLFFPAIGADNGIKLYVQCGTDKRGVKHGVDHIVCNLNGRACGFGAKQSDLFVGIDGVLGLRAGDAGEYGLETCDCHCGVILLARDFGGVGDANMYSA